MRDFTNLFSMDHEDFFRIFCREPLSWFQELNYEQCLDPVMGSFEYEEQVHPGSFQQDLRESMNADICFSTFSVDWNHGEWILQGRERLSRLLQPYNFDKGTVETAFLLWILVCNGAREYSHDTQQEEAHDSADKISSMMVPSES